MVALTLQSKPQMAPRMTGLFTFRMTFRSVLWTAFLAAMASNPVLAAAPLTDDLDSSLPGSRSSIGINGKESVIYGNLGKVALLALKQNQAPIVDPVPGGASVATEAVSEEFSTYCLDSDFSDKVAWRRRDNGEIWLQFSCLKDGEYPAIRERLFVLTIAPVEGKTSAWKLLDFRLLSANIEPGSKLEFKPQETSGMRSPVARATVAITGAVLLSAIAANRSYPNQDDKIHHAVASGVLAAGAASYFHFIKDMSPEKSALAGGAISILVGGGKEALDPVFNGVRSKHDMKANMLGVALGTVTVYLSFKFN